MAEKIRVYKRIDSWREIFQVFTNSGYLVNRPWMCSGVPEDSRKTCYETWEDAMHWATMPSEERIAKLEHDALFEMGQ